MVASTAKSFEEGGGFTNELILGFQVPYVELNPVEVFVEKLIKKFSVRRTLNGNPDLQGMPPSVPCIQSSPRSKCLRKLSTSAISDARRSFVNP